MTLWKGEQMKLSDREQNIVLATIRLWNVNAKNGMVFDCELIKNSFLLETEEIREIRNIIQSVKPKKSSPACPVKRIRNKD